MKEYLIVYKNGETTKVNCADKESLVDEYFEGDKEKFKNEVERLIWSSLSIHYVEDVQKEEIDTEITTADVNPYGWRNA